jgi:hypothetical protein
LVHSPSPTTFTTMPPVNTYAKRGARGGNRLPHTPCIPKHTPGSATRHSAQQHPTARLCTHTRCRRHCYAMTNRCATTIHCCCCCCCCLLPGKHCFARRALLASTDQPHGLTGSGLQQDHSLACIHSSAASSTIVRHNSQTQQWQPCMCSTPAAPTAGPQPPATSTTKTLTTNMPLLWHGCSRLRL